MTARDLLAACRASLPDAAPWDAVEAALTQRTGGGRFHHPAAASGSHGPAVRVSHLPGGARMLTLHGRRESAESAERTLTA